MDHKQDYGQPLQASPAMQAAEAMINHGQPMQKTVEIASWALGQMHTLVETRIHDLDGIVDVTERERDHAIRELGILNERIGRAKLERNAMSRLLRVIGSP